MLEAIADMAPVKKPVSGPKAIPVMAVMAVTGLNPGRTAKINRPVTEIADITAMTMTSRALGFLLSNWRKKGTQAKKAMIIEIRLYFLSLKSLTPRRITMGIPNRRIIQESS